jgi:hypothetical protein
MMTNQLKFKCFFILTIVFGSIKIFALEEPDYELIKEYDEIEIRKYSYYLVAETKVDTSFEDAGNIAHGILFEYISGNNVRNEKMEMTVPVNQSNQEESGEKIDMAVPVTQEIKLKNDGQYNVSFVIPSKYTSEDVPLPRDSSVSIREIPGKMMAVRKYSGTWSKENYRENEKILLDAIEKYKLKQIGDPVYARYNPPWWPWFLRRNEVMVEINPANFDDFEKDKE